MSKLILSRPAASDANELLAFELANRQWFESWVNPRPAGYYSLNAVQTAIAQAIDEAKADKAHQFLIKADGRIIGRINLTQIAREHFNKASLGYRMAQTECGKGQAKQAVAQLLGIAFGELALWRIEATVRPHNQGSARVLLANGFHQYGRSIRCIQIKDQWEDLLMFECHAGKRISA